MLYHCNRSRYLHVTATKFLSALAKDGMINESMISDQELSVVYSPLREQVNESLRRQETLLANIQVCFAKIHLLCVDR